MLFKVKPHVEPCYIVAVEFIMVEHAISLQILQLIVFVTVLSFTCCFRVPRSTESTEAHFLLQNTRYLPNSLAYLSKLQGIYNPANLVIASRFWKITLRIWLLLNVFGEKSEPLWLP